MKAGAGHIEQVGKTYYLRVWRNVVDRETGEVLRRQTRITLGSASKLRSEAAARKVADRWIASQNPESLQPGMQVTVCEYLEHFLATHVALMRPSSQRRYRSVINFYLVPEFGSDLLEQVDARRVQALASKLAPTKARETVRGVIAIVLQALGQARRDGFAVHRFERNAIKLPKASAVGREKRVIRDEELRLLVSESAQPWRALWALMGYAGLRCGEALGLTWDHIDLEAGVIRVRQSAVLGQLQLPKTRTSRADVPILPELDAELRAYRLVWDANDRALLFVGRHGGPLRADNVRERQLRPTLKRLGLRHAGLHGFRHGLPARLDGIGVSPGVIQKCMRHASIEQTEAYLHVGNDDVRAALEAARSRTSTSATPNSP